MIIHNIYFNTFGYVIALSNHPNNIVRLYSSFTLFDAIREKQKRYEVFILPENIKFILNYKHIATDKHISINSLLIHCKFLSQDEREFIKLQLV